MIARTVKNKILMAAGCLILLTAFAYLPSLKNGFTNLDDGVYITGNPAIRDFSWQGLGTIFTSFHQGLYKPLVFFTYAIEYHFAGLDPGIYHTTNLIFHILNTLGVFWLIALLSRRFWPAFITAVLFGIHPMHVESVAWITERKDMLYGFFFLGASIAYLYFRRTGRARYSCLSLVCLTLSLLSKPMAVTLPFVLIAYDYHERRKWDRAFWTEKIPYLMIAGAFGALAFLSGYFLGSTFNLSRSFHLWQSLELAGYSLLFYLGKLLFPIKLAALYPYPEKPGSFLQPLFVYAPHLATVLAGGIFLLRRVSRKIPFAFLFFGLSLLPTLQFLRFGAAIAADRYIYISSIGIFYLIGEGFSRLYEKNSQVLRGILWGALAASVSVLSFLTFRQCKVWKDNITLWNDVITKYPRVAMAHLNRGNEFSVRGDFERALADYEEALRISPYYADAYHNRGNVYRYLGQTDKAIADYREALRLKPDFPQAEQNLRRTQKGYDAAIGVYSAAIARQQDLVKNYYNRATVYADHKLYNEAIADFTKALGLDPRLAEAYNNRGSVYYEQRLYPEAEADYRRALQLKPGMAEVHYNLALMEDKIGKKKEALRAYRDFVRLAAGTQTPQLRLARARIQALSS